LLKDSTPKYKVETSQMLSLLKNYDSNSVSPEQIAEILLNNDSTFQLIDLRSPKEFAAGHLNGALNMPLQNLLNPENKPILSTETKTNILYYSDHCGACGPWMLVTQLGYKNNKILLGGYDYVNEFIIKEFKPFSGAYRDEKPKYDYAEYYNKLKGSGAVTTTKKDNESAPVIPVKKKTKGSSGGC